MSEPETQPAKLYDPVNHAESLAKALYLTVKDQQRRIEGAELSTAHAILHKWRDYGEVSSASCGDLADDIAAALGHQQTRDAAK